MTIAPRPMHAERTGEPSTLRWVTHHPGLAASPAGHRTPSADSPLGALVAEGSIIRIDLTGSDLLVHAGPDPDWPTLAPRIRDALAAELDEFDRGGARWLAVPTGEVDAPTVDAVQATVDATAGKLLNGHGGSMTVVDVDHGEVRLHPGGTCETCRLSDVTLIERLRPAIRRAHPGIIDVVLVGARPDPSAGPADPGHCAENPVVIPTRRRLRRSRGDSSCH